METTNFVKPRDRDYIAIDVIREEDERTKQLAPGIYNVEDKGNMLASLMVLMIQDQRDKLIKFKTGIVSKVIEKVSKFFSKETEDAYKELKIFHSMGIIMHGPHGTGKTCACRLIMEELVEKYKAVCLDFTGWRLYSILPFVKKIREIQDSPIIIFVDEVEAAFARDENSYLTFLEGTDSVDRTIFMGCTNYLNKISDRIKYRKSRIKYLFEIKSFPIEVYKEYVIDRLPSLEKEKVAEFGFRAEEKGLTLDQLKHAIIDYRIEGVSIEESVNGVLGIETKKDDSKESLRKREDESPGEWANRLLGELGDEEGDNNNNDDDDDDDDDD